MNTVLRKKSQILFLQNLSCCLNPGGWLVGNLWTITGDFIERRVQWQSTFNQHLGKNELTYGERVCKAYQKGKTIPDRIWDDGTGNYHEKVQSDQICDFIFGLSRKKIKDIIS